MNPPVPPALGLLVVGGGAVVAEFYVPALKGLGWLEKTWVSDPSDGALTRLTAAAPDLKTMKMDFRAALDRAPALGVRAVIVALPNALHEPAVELALDRGFDILCEKPLALTEAACLRLAERADDAGRILCVGMTRRFLPAVGALRHALDAGWIGELVSVQAEEGHDFAWSSESGIYGRSDNAGVVANVGVHALDLVEHLCGPLTPVAYTDDWRGGVEVNATFELETAARIPVRLSFSYTHELSQQFTICGTRGEVSMKAGAPTARYRSLDGRVSADISVPHHFRSGDWPLTFESAMREEFCDFVEAVVCRRPPCATARDAARTAALIDWAYAHHKEEVLRRCVTVGSAASRLQPGRIVVTGGTGFVGGHLLEALSARGHDDIVVPIRSYQRTANTWRFPVQRRPADFMSRADTRELLHGARYVFHLAYGRDGVDASRVTVEGTQNVVEAAIDAGVECVVVLSTTAVFGDPAPDSAADESLPYAPRTEYERSKAEAERWTMTRAPRANGTRVVVVNAVCVYGPRGKAFVELPARCLRDEAFCWIDDGQGLVNYVYAANLADALMLAASTPTAHGQRFIVSDGSTTWRRFFGSLFGARADALPSYTRSDLQALARGRSPRLRDLARVVIRNPDLWEVVRGNTRLAGLKSMVRDVSPKLAERVRAVREHRSNGSQPADGIAPPEWLADLYGISRTTFSPGKAREVLGWTPRIDLDAGLASSREWLAQVGLLDKRP